MNDPILFRRAVATVDDLVGAALHCAASMESHVLRLDVGAYAGGLRLEERLHRLRAALLAARWEAEAAGVRIAIELPCDAFALGVIGWRDLLDDLATPWVGVALDLLRLPTTAEQCNWIDTLAGRILIVCSPRNAEAEAALRRVHFTGLTF